MRTGFHVNYLSCMRCKQKTNCHTCSEHTIAKVMKIDGVASVELDIRGGHIVIDSLRDCKAQVLDVLEDEGFYTFNGSGAGAREANR